VAARDVLKATIGSQVGLIRSTPQLHLQLRSNVTRLHERALAGVGLLAQSEYRLMPAEAAQLEVANFEDRL
jgi:hypothetical protein